MSKNSSKKPAKKEVKSENSKSMTNKPIQSKEKQEERSVSTFGQEGHSVEVNSESTVAIFLTAFEYVANDLRKKFSQFLMCCMTVFLTVSFITFLNGAGKLSPIIVMKNTVFSAGDYDITILGKGFGNKEIVKSNNFYNDHAEIWDTPFKSNVEKMNLHTMAQL
jgi:hypothetical protein